MKMFLGYLMIKSKPVKCVCGHTNKRHTIKPEDKYPCDIKTCSCPDFEELSEMKRKDFMKLRAELHNFIYSKKRNLDDLVYTWDFFREHMIG